MREQIKDKLGEVRKKKKGMHYLFLSKPILTLMVVIIQTQGNFFLKTKATFDYTLSLVLSIIIT